MQKVRIILLVLSLLGLVISTSCQKESVCKEIIGKECTADGTAIIYTLNTSEGEEKVYTNDNAYKVGNFYCH
jgi:hypothetical protein